MTFTEAAVQVLRLVGKPLHYKEITDVAIEKDLLSHVGKSPEVTMGARLAAIVKKDPKETQLVRLKPGVFALSEWDNETIEKGLADRTPALKRIEQRQREGLIPAAGAAPLDTTVGNDSTETVETAAAPGEQMDDDEIARAELTAAANELFEEEEDDDEPILGRDDDDEEEDAVIDEEDDDDSDRRRGRRRRGRGRNRSNERGGGDDDLPGYTVSDASEVALPETAVEAPPERQEFRQESRQESRQDKPRRAEPGLIARDLADDVEQWLGAFRRQGGALASKLAEQGRRPSGGHEFVAAQIVACCATDNARMVAEGKRPRFRFVSNNRIALTEWSLDKDLLRLEKEMWTAIEKYRELLRQRLGRKIAELPHKAFAEFAFLVLERLGYKRLSVVKRPGAHASELHLSGVLVAGGSETPVAIVVRKDGRDIGRERVTELRGSLHHYGSCSLGVLVTAGQVLSGARDEAAVAGATPVTFLDGATIASLCEQFGIATIPMNLSLSVPDLDLFDVVRSGQ
jgi:hypothetical protein